MSFRLPSIVQFCKRGGTLIVSEHTLVVQVRASAALELEQVINEVKRQVEKEKEIAVIETKKKKWVSA